MKAIKVSDKNIGKIAEAIEMVQKRTRERNINVEDVLKAIEYIEEYFSIPKIHMVGLSINYDYWADTYPNAYRYTPYSTQFIVDYRRSGWFISNIRRDRTGGTERNYVVVNMPDEVKNALVKRFSRF